MRYVIGAMIYVTGILLAVHFASSASAKPREQCHRWWVDMDERLCHRDGRYTVPCGTGRKDICNYGRTR